MMTNLLGDMNPFRQEDPFFRLNALSYEDLITKYEKIKTKVFSAASEASVYVAQQIANLIKQKNLQGKNCVLGLATGSSPLKVYQELIRMHEQEGLSFAHVVTFNLDEYYPMQPSSLQSYHRFMREHFFDHIDIPSANIHIPEGNLNPDDIYSYCNLYELEIEKMGGLDLQLLGIGRTGHIGFNEPGSDKNSPTRLISLDHLTRIDAASDFYGEENVPKKAITMGIGTIFKSKRIILLAFGEGKSAILARAVEGEISSKVPASFLQEHGHIEIIADQSAAAHLTRFSTPWLVGPCQWTPRLTRKGVVWLCQKLCKPILKLTDRDYNDNGMSDLISQKGPSNNINIQVFNDLQHTISGWPGGKPGADDSTRPERANPFPKRVLVFSPHPDDDVISMGGTLTRLVDQGHEVHIGYQTSGSIAVFDDEVIRYLDFIQEYFSIFEQDISSHLPLIEEVTWKLGHRDISQDDSREVLLIKKAIRRGEALSACRYMGIPAKNVQFLDLPFYETGRIRKNPLGPMDIQVVEEYIHSVKPHQIYAAGDLSDPHGTHRICLDVIIEALKTVRHETWFADCRVWLYRGAWQEWDLDQVDMAVPLSPEEVKIKRRGIFKHQSQKDRPLFPGIDSREFWQRAEDRNHATAVLYDKLGMAEYQAMEVFVRYLAAGQ